MIRISQAQENFVAARIFLVPYVNHVVGFVANANYLPLAIVIMK